MTEDTLAVRSNGAEELADEDLRAQLQDAIAELLAELSEPTDSPKGIRVGAQFTSFDVDFGDDSWVNRLADVQGWLYFREDLPIDDRADFVMGVAGALGIEDHSDGVESYEGVLRLTDGGLELLRARAELATKHRQNFLTAIEAEGGNLESATVSWVEAWDAEEDSTSAPASEPVEARAETLPISELTDMDLNLTPSYQRGDVWRTGDRQTLIESILRGIPLPSVILLQTGPATPHEVVDGKQRLTAILRFVGKHPVAQAKVAEEDARHPDAELSALFETDYPRFRTMWRRTMGYPLTAKLEDEYYFPFKLRNDAHSGLVGANLEPLRGKYFTEIKSDTIRVAKQEITVERLFRRTVNYKVPVIIYEEATPKQVHEVFKLYNKQGMHLNAEEILNAIYHDVELTRGILVAAGDASGNLDITAVTPSLAGVQGIAGLGKTLAEYGFGAARYRRTKVLGWIVATLLNDTQGKLPPTTATHTDNLLRPVQENASHALRSPARLADLFGLITTAVDIHATHDELWPERFRGGKGGKWQDLPLVGSLLGIVIALAGTTDDIEDRIDASAEAIHAAALRDWKRPEKTQTRTQWDYIARIAHGVVELLGVDIHAASKVIQERFGSTGVESLLGAILRDTK